MKNEKVLHSSDDDSTDYFLERQNLNTTQSDIDLRRCYWRGLMKRCDETDEFGHILTLHCLLCQ